MYAVIRTGGKQYKVTQGDTLDVEALPAAPGADVELDEVLLLIDGDKVTVGTPTVAGAKVLAQVVGHGRGEKVKIIKFRRRKHYRRLMGHRQNYTRLQITRIEG
jgi:large subunit ribosomal protein L21